MSRTGRIPTKTFHAGSVMTGPTVPSGAVDAEAEIDVGADSWNNGMNAAADIARSFAEAEGG
jgi:hypothetical protein